MAFSSQDMRNLINILESASQPIQLNEAATFDLSALGIDLSTGNITKPGANADTKSLGAQIGLDLDTGAKTKYASAFGDKKAGVVEDPETVFKEMFPFTKMLRKGDAPDEFLMKFLNGDLSKLALHNLDAYESIEQHDRLVHYRHIFASKAGNYGVYVDVTFLQSEEDPMKGWRNGAPLFLMGGKTKEDLSDIDQLFAQEDIGQNKVKTADEKKAVHDKRQSTINNRGFAVGDIVYKSRKTVGPLTPEDMKVEWKIAKITPAGKIYISQHNTARNDGMSWPVNPANLRKK